MAYRKLTRDGPATPSDLVAAFTSYVFALFVAVSVGENLSGGHVNWWKQNVVKWYFLLDCSISRSSMACLLLKVTLVG